LAIEGVESRGAGVQGCRGAEEQRSRGAGEQGRFLASSTYTVFHKKDAAFIEWLIF